MQLLAGSILHITNTTYILERGLDEYVQIDIAWVYLVAPTTSRDAIGDSVHPSERTLLSFNFECESRESIEELKAFFMMCRINTDLSQQQLYASLGNRENPTLVFLYTVLRIIKYRHPAIPTQDLSLSSVQMRGSYIGRYSARRVRCSADYGREPVTRGFNR